MQFAKLFNTKQTVIMFSSHVRKEPIISFTITIKGSCLENSLDTIFFQYPLFTYNFNFTFFLFLFVCVPVKLTYKIMSS